MLALFFACGCRGWCRDSGGAAIGRELERIEDGLGQRDVRPAERAECEEPTGTRRCFGDWTRGLEESPRSGCPTADDPRGNREKGNEQVGGGQSAPPVEPVVWGRPLEGAVGSNRSSTHLGLRPAGASLTHGCTAGSGTHPAWQRSPEFHNPTISVRTTSRSCARGLGDSNERRERQSL